MSFTSATGFSVKKNAMKAINEAFNKAKSQIQGEVSFVLVYFTIYYPVDELENAFQDVFQNIPNAGCSGEGVIGQNAIVEGNEPGVSITVFSGKKVNFYPQIFENINNRNEEVGIEVSHWMRKKK